LAVRVVTHAGEPVPLVPVVADRRALAEASPSPCGWTNERGVATLVVRVGAARAIVPVGIATVAPGCGLAGGDEQWPARLDVLMKTNAFPDMVRLDVPAGEHADGEAATTEVSGEIRAEEGMRVLAQVRYLRDRVLFATPQREEAFNPMWQLFALAERVPTDRVILDGVPARAGARIRLTSNSGGVSRLVTVDGSRAQAADLEGVAGKQLDLGVIEIPQEIARYPVNERITALDGAPLLAGRTVGLTLASKAHPELLFHVDVMGGSRAPATGQRDQRAYVPAGAFALVPTNALRGPREMFAFFDAVMESETEAASGFPTITVDPTRGVAGTDLEMDESAARRAAAVMEETRRN
jgi:hypothetical protein